MSEDTPAPAAAPAADKKQKKKDKKKNKVRSAWISFVGRIVGQVVGAVATVVLGLTVAGRIRSHKAEEPPAASSSAPARVTARAGKSTVSLAVLPLQNLSGDSKQDYFADGMTDALITDLAGIPGLRVISRTSSMSYKGERKPVPEVARELDVELIVEGSVVRAGDRVRITAQLIDAQRDQHLWARSYDREIGG